jgi:hypothetical protein
MYIRVLMGTLVMKVQVKKLRAPLTIFPCALLQMQGAICGMTYG